MKKKSDNPHILLIRSPFCPPGTAPKSWAFMASALETLTDNLQINDAATSFFQQVIIEGRHFRPKAGFRLSDARRLSSTARYDPLDLMADLASMDLALDQISSTYGPCRFHHHGFAHPGLNCVDDVLKFADDPDANPFWHFAHNMWQPFPHSTIADVALLYVKQPGQMGAASTLASAWRKRWPQIPFKLVGPASAMGKGRQKNKQWPFEVITSRSQLQEVLARTLSMSIDLNIEVHDPKEAFKDQRIHPLMAEHMPELVESALKENTALMTWQAGISTTSAAFKQLYAASRQGIWNHLILDSDTPADIKGFAVSNPNIVHAFCYGKKQSSAFSDPEYNFPAIPMAYGDTWPMPGTPLWMKLRGAVYIGKLLSQYDAKTLMRLRVKNDGRALFEVGQNLSYRYKRPADLPEGYLDEIVRMVAAGGSVNTQFVRGNLQNAFLIAYVEEEGVIIGNSCLKRPRKEYIEAVSQQSKIDLHNYLERGYASVRPEYRGLGVGAKLMKELTRRGGEHKIFAVIAESNIATQKMAIRNRNLRVATFFSQRAKKDMSVWIPEQMLPKGIALPEQPKLA